MYTVTTKLIVGWSILSAVTGCAGASPPPAPPEAATPATTAAAEPSVSPAEPQPASSTTSTPSSGDELDIPPMGAAPDRIMQAHFQDALLIRQAVIDGRPQDAANPATVIANLQNLEKLPEGWRPFVEDMQATAQRITNGTTAAAVAGAAADLGLTCGACHAKLGGPKPSADPAPSIDASLESRMEHHAWATERLWEGLATPSDQAWNTGAQALTTQQIPLEVTKKGGVDARSAAKDFKNLVAKAPSRKTTQERASLYAELLVTCGTCHQAMNGSD